MEITEQTGAGFPARRLVIRKITAVAVERMKKETTENREPEKSFMLKFEGRVSQALTAQKVRLKSEKQQLEPEKEKHTKISQDRRFQKTGKAREREVQDASLTTAIIRTKKTPMRTEGYSTGLLEIATTRSHQTGSTEYPRRT
jgi:hypothetical protein